MSLNKGVIYTGLYRQGIWTKHVHLNNCKDSTVVQFSLSIQRCVNMKMSCEQSLLH